MDAHRLSPQETLEKLEVDSSRGLSPDEATRRLDEHGPNELPETKGPGIWSLIWEQLSSVLVLLLIGAAGVSAALGDYTDAVAILAIVILNTALGVRQELKAEHAMAALKKLSAPHMKVRRGGSLEDRPAPEAVPGDIVVLEAGAAVPADCRLLEAANLRLEEAALTGESGAVEKNASFMAPEGTAIADRVNMVYAGSTVSYGRGIAVVTGTGLDTELGRISQMLADVQRDPTPLQERLDELGRTLVVAAGLIVALIFALGVYRGEDLELMFLTAVSLAVAAVPEGLPAVVTIALALGAQAMLRRNALIRKLPAVETLGSVTVICSDKTGTLTENRMSVSETWTRDSDSDALLLAAAGSCNDATLEGEGDDLHAVGDPTETALVLAAARADLDPRNLASALPRIDERPFDSDRKRMATLHERKGDSPVDEAIGDAPYVVFAKGAPEQLLDVCADISDDDRKAVLDENDRMAGDGLRVLAVAYRPVDQRVESENLESDLIFVGLVGLIDPPRPEAREAVRKCREAGVREIMITGDQILTARRVAADLELGEEGALSGAEVDKLSKDELEEAVQKTTVFARVSPEHKLRIVDALQARGQVVAMTGDGVNDAPALKSADIGVAMGQVGTDVAKQAADVVLRDDNFATIVAAVEEGRAIYDNIRKFLRYLLSANAGELLVMIGGSLIGMPPPLLPLQILWMNLVTDGPPALAMGAEPAEPDVMRRPPRDPEEGVFARGLGVDVLWIGLLTAVVTLIVTYDSWAAGNEAWRTMTFTTLTLAQIFLALGLRSESASFLSIPFSANRALPLAVAGSAAVQMAVIYSPWFQPIFKTQSLTLNEIGICTGAALVPLIAVEIRKRFAGRGTS